MKRMKQRMKTMDLLSPGNWQIQWLFHNTLLTFTDMLTQNLHKEGQNTSPLSPNRWICVTMLRLRWGCEGETRGSVSCGDYVSLILWSSLLCLRTDRSPGLYCHHSAAAVSVKLTNEGRALGGLTNPRPGLWRQRRLATRHGQAQNNTGLAKQTLVAIVLQLQVTSLSRARREPCCRVTIHDALSPNLSKWLNQI